MKNFEIIENANGTSRFTHPKGYNSWLDYWELQAGRIASQCSACENKDDLVGAHVRKVLGDDNHLYIIPLCKSCNKKTGMFSAFAEFIPVPSNL